MTFNFENQETDYTNGIDSHLDVGFAKFLSEQLFVGAVGFAYQQVTPDEGQPAVLGDFESRVFGIGPQVGYNFIAGGVPIYTNLRGYIVSRFSANGTECVICSREDFWLIVAIWRAQMRQKSGTQVTSSEQVVKDIRRATRKHHAAE